MDNRLDLYDSLTPAQKALVAEYIRQQPERLHQTRGLLLRFPGGPVQ